MQQERAEELLTDITALVANEKTRASNCSASINGTPTFTPCVRIWRQTEREILIDILVYQAFRLPSDTLELSYAYGSSLIQHATKQYKEQVKTCVL